MARHPQRRRRRVSLALWTLGLLVLVWLAAYAFQGWLSIPAPPPRAIWLREVSTPAPGVFLGNLRADDGSIVEPIYDRAPSYDAHDARTSPGGTKVTGLEVVTVSGAELRVHPSVRRIEFQRTGRRLYERIAQLFGASPCRDSVTYFLTTGRVDADGAVWQQFVLAILGQ